MQETDSKEVADVISPYFEDTDASIIAMAVERYKAQESFALVPILDQAEWANLQDIMKEAGELDSFIDHQTLVDTSFAKEVSK